MLVLSGAGGGKFRYGIKVNMPLVEAVPIIASPAFSVMSPLLEITEPPILSWSVTRPVAPASNRIVPVLELTVPRMFNGLWATRLMLPPLVETV